MTERKKICKICGYYYIQKCPSCAKRGIKNPMFGIHRDLSGTKNPRYKDGRSKPKLCPICKKKIINYRSKRCQSCAVKYLYKIGKLNSKGERNGCWKNGITPLHRLIRNLPEYSAWRDRIFKRDNYTCQNCRYNKGSQLEVHHKISFAILLNQFLEEYNQFSPIEDKEILVRLSIKWSPFWDFNNGITLCKDCHDLTRQGRPNGKKH